MGDTKTLNPQILEVNKNYPQQGEMFLATVKGKETVLPEDLYAVSYTHLRAHET